MKTIMMVKRCVSERVHENHKSVSTVQVLYLDKIEHGQHTCKHKCIHTYMHAYIHTCSDVMQHISSAMCESQVFMSKKYAHVRSTLR